MVAASSWWIVLVAALSSASPYRSGTDAMAEPAPAVLVVEDEVAIRRFITAALDSHGFRTIEAGTAKDAAARATEHVPDALLIDLGLPDRDGIDLIRDLRGWSQAPIIVLSARGREEDKVRGLDAGADDYLTKPFGVPELLARLRAVLRRRQRAESGAEPVLRSGDLSIDIADHRARLGADELRLTPVEFKLLAELMRHAGRLVTHAQLTAAVWGPGSSEDAQYLRVYIHQLRRKIEEDPAEPRRLITEVGVGYRLTEAP
jgi:two-component system KDP operon response regulator KdpE